MEMIGTECGDWNGFDEATTLPMCCWKLQRGRRNYGGNLARVGFSRTIPAVNKALQWIGEKLREGI